MRRTSKRQLGEHEKIQAINTLRLVQDSVGAVQVVIDIPDLRGEL